MKPCAACGGTKWIGVEYQGTSEDWDGVSEWLCEKCGARFGRWTGKRLADDELEPRHGIPRKANP